MEEALLKKEQQANDFRGRFFTWTIVLVGIAVVVSAAAMTAYLVSQWHDLSDVVMTAWFSSTIVEVLGLAGIVARYLFKSDEPRSRGKKKK